MDTDFSELNIPQKEDILEAHELIKPYINKTPILSSNKLNSYFKCDLFFKCENFQKVGAFKSRGACNAVFSLKDNDVKNGVCTHSSGNHAQALARAANLRNIPAYIVMPETSPKVKVEAVKEYGGNITFCKPTLQARENTLDEVIRETGATEIHPYNKFEIIAGQASAAKELIDEIPDLDIVLCPVGGGGLLSGSALAVHYFSPNIKIIAAEPDGANDAFRSFYEGKFIPSIEPNTIADGLLTSLGSLTYPIIREYVDQIVTCSEEAIIDAMKLIWTRMKVIVEPSAAVPLATLLENKFDYKRKRIGIILSGGNIDLEKLPF
jgi:threonine dehydratase